MNRALIVKKKWLDKILSGEKRWEIRGSNTNIRGVIGLIESGSGVIMGECELYDSDYVWDLWSRLSVEQHMVINKSDINYKNPHVWKLKNAKRYNKPTPYTHPQGAVVWVKIKDNK